ncbi:UNVERIFIED_CONTAM: hypothetical protein K2H54_020880 [Gekko kuhli]
MFVLLPHSRAGDEIYCDSELIQMADCVMVILNEWSFWMVILDESHHSSALAILAGRMEYLKGPQTTIRETAIKITDSTWRIPLSQKGV